MNKKSVNELIDMIDKQLKVELILLKMGTGHTRKRYLSIVNMELQLAWYWWSFTH